MGDHERHAVVPDQPQAVPMSDADRQASIADLTAKLTAVRGLEQYKDLEASYRRQLDALSPPAPVYDDTLGMAGQPVGEAPSAAVGEGQQTNEM